MLKKQIQGFLEDPLAFEPGDASLAIEVAFPKCQVVPTSKLIINQTAVDNGDASVLSATFVVRGGGQGNTVTRV